MKYFFSAGLLLLFFLSCQSMKVQKMHYEYDSVNRFHYRPINSEPGYWEKAEKKITSTNFFLLISYNAKTEFINRKIARGEYRKNCTFYSETNEDIKNISDNRRLSAFWNNHGICYLFEGNYQKALESLRYAGSLDSENAHILDNIRKMINLDYLKNNDYAK